MTPRGHSSKPGEGRFWTQANCVYRAGLSNSASPQPAWFLAFIANALSQALSKSPVKLYRTLR